MSKKYRPHEFAKIIGKTTKTLRRWDASGKLPAKRGPTNQRYYDEEDVKKALGLHLPTVEKSTVVYCRVSSKGQSDDLKSQIAAMEQYCLGAGVKVDEWVEEIAGGMNFKRKKFLNLMTQIEHCEIEKLIIAHKDRLVRFGFDYFEHFASTHGCEVIVVNQQSLSPQQEMVEDLMAIIHCFSSRLYGLRNYKKKIREAIESEQ